MAKPKLTREDCADIRRMYSDRTRDVGTSNIAHLFKVSSAVVNNVLNRNYTPLEDYEERLAEKRSEKDKRYKVVHLPTGIEYFFSAKTAAVEKAKAIDGMLLKRHSPEFRYELVDTYRYGRKR